MPSPYPNGTKVHLLPTEIVDDFMGLGPNEWELQRRYNNNVHVIIGNYTDSHHVLCYSFESTYCGLSYYWNAKYVLPIDEDSLQYDVE